MEPCFSFWSKIFVAFFAGILIAAAFLVERFIFSICLFVAFFIGICLLKLIRRSVKFKRLVLIFSSALLGFFHFACYEVLTLNSVKEFNEARENVCGVVEDFEQYDNGGCCYVLKISKIADRGFLIPIRLKLYSKNLLDLDYGDEVCANVLLSSNFEGSFFGYFFNSSLSRGIYLRGKKASEVEKRSKFSIFSVFSKFRDSLIKSVNCNVKEPESSVLNGILFGKRQNMPYKFTRAADRCGISHVFCVSGLHVSILVAVLVSFFNLLKMKRKISFVVAFLMLFIYSVIAGFTPSVARACLMAISGLFSSTFKVRINPVTSLFFAAFVILIFAPTAVFGLSFALSFSSCLGIVLFSKRIYNWLIVNFNIYSRFKIFVAESVSVSVSAMVFSAPFLMVSFGKISVVSIFVNLIIMPLIPLIFVLGVLTAVFGFVCSEVASFLGSVCGGLVNLIYAVIFKISSFPFCYIPTNFSFVIFSIVGILIFSIVSFFYFRNFLFSRSFAFFSFLIAFVPAVCFKFATERMAMLAVVGNGFGSSVVLNYCNKTVVINCGGGFASGEKLCQFLDSKGIVRVDCLVLSSFKKRDVSGAATVLQEIPVKWVVFPKAEGKNAAKDFTISKKQAIIFEDYSNFRLGSFFVEVAKMKKDVYFHVEFDGLKFSYATKLSNLEGFDENRSVDFAVLDDFRKKDLNLEVLTKFEQGGFESFDFADFKKITEFTFKDGRLKRGRF